MARRPGPHGPTPPTPPTPATPPAGPVRITVNPVMAATVEGTAIDIPLNVVVTPATAATTLTFTFTAPTSGTVTGTGATARYVPGSPGTHRFDYIARVGRTSKAETVTVTVSPRTVATPGAAALGAATPVVRPTGGTPGAATVGATPPTGGVMVWVKDNWRGPAVVALLVLLFLVVWNKGIFPWGGSGPVTTYLLVVNPQPVVSPAPRTPQRGNQPVVPRAGQQPSPSGVSSPKVLVGPFHGPATPDRWMSIEEAQAISLGDRR